VAEIALMAAKEVKRFGVEPKVALLSHSNFGSVRSDSALKMAAARALIEQRAPWLEVDGEMHGDAALSQPSAKALPRLPPHGRSQPADHAQRRCRQHRLQPDQGHCSGDGITVGPVLLGAAKPVHILTKCHGATRCAAKR
jgi:malate dehydrogenase (oxaloacetate-decarboxylating)(NADP+)